VRAPVILVPGLGGSVLESKLDHVTQPHTACASTHDWQVEWVVPSVDFVLIDCLLNNLRVRFDPKTTMYHNNTGVEIRPYKFGGLEGVAALDPQLPAASGTYADMIKALGRAGYREKTNLFGAPYDFRLAADGLEQIGWYKRFQNLIEEAVEKNHGQPAVLITHSMGGLVTYYFLKMMEQDSTAVLQDWTRRHVAGLIALAAPWEGSVTAMKGQISGDPFDLPVPHALLRPVQKTSPSGPWLFPRAAAYGGDVLVETTGGDSYTASVDDALRLLHDLKLSQQAAIYPRVSELINPLTPLQVPVHCVYGTDVDTEVGYVYDVKAFSGEVPPAPHRIRQGPGDGTVNLRSLQSCRQLGPMAEQHVPNPNATHLGILMDDAAIDLVLSLVEDLQQHPPFLQRSFGASDKAFHRSIFGRIRAAFFASE
jgi:pimeloyl-ACP methyl ester carboxylesterase